ncbi:unnamed protein product [Hermetia illucens]|uniref:Uncharacterized protein n=2 Tax=Hermetia illucens TaxID=343691 RepID=A0A7R8UQD4_HERIL|nr:unnamed protein product [Hermetia illucens]
MDEIYERSGNLLENQFIKVSDGADSEKIQKAEEFTKLMEVLAPYYSLPENYDRGKRDREDIQTDIADNLQRGRMGRNIAEKTFQNRNSFLPESSNFGFREDKWPVNTGLPGDSGKQSISVVGQHKAVNRRIRCPVRNMAKRSKDLRRLRKRFDLPLPVLDPRPVMNSAPSLYPSIMAKTADLTALAGTPKLDVAAGNLPKLDAAAPNAPANINVNGLNTVPNIVGTVGATDASFPSLNQIKDLQNLLLQASPRHAPDYNPATDSGSLSQNCDQNSVSTNVSEVLERVLTELEAIREAKVGNLTADGTPCDVAGFWNSEIAGVRFDISLQNPNANCSTDIKVAVRKKRKKRKDSLMDTTWTCTGSTIKPKGGPFSLVAQKKGSNVLATFTGFCAKCGGCDIIFGSWTFVYPCKNCTEISLAIETKRDIFRRDMDEEKKAKEKLEPKEKKPSCLREDINGDKQRNDDAMENIYQDDFNADSFY